MKNIINALSFALVFIPTLALAQTGNGPTATSAADNSLGQQQVEKLWSDFAKPDLTDLNLFVAPGFQSLHEDGARDWPQERLLVAKLKLTPYVLSDYKVTRNGDVLVVTYQCKVGETIAQARIATTSTPRLDVFQMVNGNWRLLSHVNVRKLSPSTSANPTMIAALPE